MVACNCYFFRAILWKNIQSVPTYEHLSMRFQSKMRPCLTFSKQNERNKRQKKWKRKWKNLNKNTLKVPPSKDPCQRHAIQQSFSYDSIHELIITYPAAGARCFLIHEFTNSKLHQFPSVVKQDEILLMTTILHPRVYNQF